MTPPRKTPPPDLNLPAARLRLGDCISALCDPKPHVIHREDGATTITWLDSLYEQLLEAVGGHTGERTGGRASMTIWPAAHDLAVQIDRKVACWCPGAPQADETPSGEGLVTVNRLRAIERRKWRVEDTRLVEDVADIIDSYTVAIGELLNPEPQTYLRDAADNRQPAACTACQTSRVYRVDPDNPKHKIMEFALKVTERGCRCQACGATWEPGQLQILAAALGYPLPAGVLSAAAIIGTSED